MRALAITGMVTSAWISLIFWGSDMRATPPSRRMSAGTRSSAITAHAPASSAIRACSAFVTSMITPPLSISARPLLTRIVPYSATPVLLELLTVRADCIREIASDLSAIRTLSAVGMLGGPAGSSTVEHGAHNSPDLGSTPSRPTWNLAPVGGVVAATQEVAPVLRMPVIVCATVAALAAPAAGQAGGLYPATDPGGGSLLSPGKTVRYQVAPGTDTTEVRAWRRKDGRLLW